MESVELGFGSLILYLNQTILKMKDPRKASNGTRYSIVDAVLGAFSSFFMQCESFLEHQRQMESHQGRNNARNLFGVMSIPTVPQIRNILDEIPASSLSGVFQSVYKALKERGHLEPFQYLGGLLIALDGTQYHSSQKVHCKNCSSRTHRNGTVSYFHSAILPVIVAPEQTQVISLAPVFITPQDGSEKQDCEVAAAKRWLKEHAGDFAGESITLLGDDLYSHTPLCKTVLAAQMNFIFTCLPESHVALYDWIDYLEETGEVETLTVRHPQKNSTDMYCYRFINGVPLSYADDACQVNWCDLTVVRESDGKVLFDNAWITNHLLQKQTVPRVAAAGRCRWKTENENHNVLKTKGYHLEHNFGHGDNHLSAFLLTLNLLAFLFHTVLHLVDQKYQKIRLKRGTRTGFFQDILSLTKYLCFESWTSLIDFMLNGSIPIQATNSS
jgi:hypothetical protein